MAEAGTGWNDRELAAAVVAYRKMQELDASGVSYNKSKVYRDLGATFGRDAGAFERRMQNISAVLSDMGRPWLKGLAPQANVGPRVMPKLRKLLEPNAIAPYHAKLPAMRQWLIEVARVADTTTYGALMAGFSLDRFNLRAALGALGHEAHRRGEPILTALVVNAATRRCSAGLEREFGVVDDDAERQRLYQYWRRTPDTSMTDLEPEDNSLGQRASKFSRQAVRPEQVAFRKRVFLASNGMCTVSGCSIPRALDAAHIKGRDWRKGHNKASDGLLLRKDLHALYDCGLLEIDKAGVVSLGDAARDHYCSYEGKPIATVAKAKK
ncbi:HNH endonuclease signature motif containing protein [Pseudoxanthomonas sp. PXM02]|uniref:HNH endonuclease signature motif containing protein n=1 Tax=Pseudoxanthomonas sp. PXM02 TaxID=2769294 RepID=UPI00177CF866|nr:HNH endonuclease signature motif containing protein [Pseudoxanthomonas sp. PXM02]MBD9479864.1 HNH endonuclease [Pseudoxanthomonas sp. PXM02]